VRGWGCEGVAGQVCVVGRRALMNVCYHDLAPPSQSALCSLHAFKCNRSGQHSSVGLGGGAVGSLFGHVIRLLAMLYCVRVQ
jgi:hypothetical protein